MNEVDNAEQVDVNVSELSDEELEGGEARTTDGEENPETLGKETDSGTEEGGDGKASEGEGSPEEGAEEQAPISTVELEKLRSQLTQKEVFIQRRNTEVGELQKRERELQATLSKRPSDDDMREKFDVDPLAAIKEVRDAEKAEDERVDLQSRMQQLDNEDAVIRVVPNFKELQNDIVALAKSDGLPERDIVDLKNNPYVFNPQDVISLARRVQDAKRIQALEDRISTISDSKQNMAKNIAKAASGGRTITSASGQSSPPDRDISRKQTSTLSDAELDEQIALDQED